MPYTRPWAPEAWLPGARDADEIDDAVSDEIANDLNERFESVIENVEADPWRLKTTGAQTTIPWHNALIATLTPPGHTYDVARLTLAGANGAVTAYVPIVAPKGSTLTNVIVRVLRTHAGASALISLIRVNPDNTITTIVNAFATSVDPAPQDIDLGALTETFDEDAKYIVAVTITAEPVVATSAAFYHVKATIDTVWGGA